MENIAISLSLVDFLGLTVVAGLVSVVLQYIKNKYNENGNVSKLLLLVFSIVVATAYWFLRDTAIWVNLVTILSIASTVYALFIKGSTVEKLGK